MLAVAMLVGLKVVYVGSLIGLPMAAVEAKLGRGELQPWPKEIGGVPAEARQGKEFRVEYVDGRAKAIERTLPLQRVFTWQEALTCVGYNPTAVKVRHVGPLVVGARSVERWRLSEGSLLKGFNASLEVERSGTEIKYQTMRVEATYAAALAALLEDRPDILEALRSHAGGRKELENADMTVAKGFAFVLSLRSASAPWFALLRRKGRAWSVLDSGSGGTEVWRGWPKRYEAPEVIFPGADEGW